jgi:hypothetical protein
MSLATFPRRERYGSGVDETPLGRYLRLRRATGSFQERRDMNAKPIKIPRPNPTT